VETPDQDHSSGGTEQHPSGVPIQRLWIPLRDEFVNQQRGPAAAKGDQAEALTVRRPGRTMARRQWLPILSVVVFLMAAIGAVFAIYTILPVFMDEHGKYSLAKFAAIFVATFLLIVLVAGLKRR